MPHTGCDVCFWAGLNRLDIMLQKKWMKNSLWTICHKCRVDGQFVHFFVDNMSGFGVDKQSVHFHVRLWCSVTVNVVYMGRKIQWTIHVGQSVIRTRRTWTIHHSTAKSQVRIQDCPKTVWSSAKEPLNILFLIGMTNENCQIQRYQFYSWSGLHLFDNKNRNVCSMTCINAVSEKCNMIKMHTLYYGMNLWKYVISYTIQSDWTISKRATLPCDTITHLFQRSAVEQSRQVSATWPLPHTDGFG